MEALTDPLGYPPTYAGSIDVHPLRENKRPVGFAAWPKVKTKKRKKRRK